jgi:hypothetical protein
MRVAQCFESSSTEIEVICDGATSFRIFQVSGRGDDLHRKIGDFSVSREPECPSECFQVLFAFVRCEGLIERLHCGIVVNTRDTGFFIRLLFCFLLLLKPLPRLLASASASKASKDVRVMGNESGGPSFCQGKYQPSQAL